MAYVDPPTWVDNTTPYLNAANLNTMSANQRDHETRINSGLDFTNEARNNNFTGGGTLSWGVVAGKFKWTERFVWAPVSSLNAPTTWFGTAATQATGSPTSGVLDHAFGERANVDGITLDNWDSLWFIHPRGNESTTGNSFRVLPLGDALLTTYFADENVHLLAFRNGDNGFLRLANGITLKTGQTLTDSGATLKAIYKVNGSDVTNTTTSFADVTGLTWAVTSGVHYKFQAILDITSNAATNGFNISMNGPTLTRGSWRISTPPTTGAAPYVPVFTQQVAFNTGTALTALTATSPNLVIIEGFMVCSASGTGAVRFHSEISTGGATITVKIGSSLEVWST